MCMLVDIYTNTGKQIKVADIKKDYIVNITKQAHLCPAIDKIVLFGSAVEERCTEESDIDIAIFGNLSEYQFLASKEYRQFATLIYQYGDFQDYDILYFRTGKKDKSNILKQIDKGETIYLRVEGQNA